MISYNVICYVGWNTTKLYHGHRKPSARLISTQVMSTHDIEADTRYTSFIMQWGQFLDHDITLTPMSVSRARYVIFIRDTACVVNDALISKVVVDVHHLLFLTFPQ